MNLATALNTLHEQEDILVFGADMDNWVGDDIIDYNLSIEEWPNNSLSGKYENFKDWAIKHGLKA